MLFSFSFLILRASHLDMTSYYLVTGMFNNVLKYQMFVLYHVNYSKICQHGVIHRVKLMWGNNKA